MIYVNNFDQFVDLSDQDDPLKAKTGLEVVRLSTPSPGATIENKLFRFSLEQNELSLNDGVVGIFEGEDEPVEFLTTNKLEYLHTQFLSGDVEIQEGAE